MLNKDILNTRNANEYDKYNKKIQNKSKTISLSKVLKINIFIYSQKIIDQDSMYNVMLNNNKKYN